MTIPDVLIGKFMELRRDPQDTSKKTPSYTIYEKRGGAPLGEIKWYGPWRGLCFFPGWDTVFDCGCLQQIREWIQTLDAAYKASKEASHDHT